MPDFCGGGGVFSAAGFCQLSGIKVMPDFFEDGAGLAGTSGIRVRAWQEGQEICPPEYSSSHSRLCPHWEQLNLRQLISFSSPAGRIIGGNGEFVQLFLPFRSGPFGAWAKACQASGGIRRELLLVFLADMPDKGLVIERNDL